MYVIQVMDKNNYKELIIKLRTVIAVKVQEIGNKKTVKLSFKKQCNEVASVFWNLVFYHAKRMVEL